jgi:hypothetical protein
MKRWWRVGSCVLLVAILASIGTAASGQAATPAFGSKFCLQGTGAGNCFLPRGIAASPTTGNLLIADQLTRRVNEFTPWGVFVRAWGWGVASGADEGQICTDETGCLTAPGGTRGGQFTLPTGVAVDSGGDVYVVDRESLRVQKFSPNGTFLRAFGGDVIINGAIGTGTVTNASATVTGVATTSKGFRVGQAITATGIAPGTRIAQVGNGTITLSQPAGPAATGAPTAISTPEAPNNVPSNEIQTVALGAKTTGGTFTLTFTVPNPSPSSATATAIPFNSSAAALQTKLEALSNIGAGNVGVSGPAGGPWAVEFKGIRFADTDVEQMSADANGLTVSEGPKQATVTSAKAGEVCTVVAECQAGSGGTANGQFSVWPLTSFITVNSGGVVYVGDENRIQVFNAEGAFQSQLPLPEPGTVGSLTHDPVSGDLYMTFTKSLTEQSPIFRLDAANGDVIDELAVDRPSALAVDSAGFFYAFDEPFPGHGTRIVKFDSSGAFIETFGEGDLERSVALTTNAYCFPGSDDGIYATNLIGTNAFVQAWGSAPDPVLCPPPQVPPEITGQFASSVDTESAMLKAQINPHYFTPPIGTTTFLVQWGTEECVDEEGWEAVCVIEQPSPPGLEIESPPGGVPVTTTGILLSGLEPDTTYRYRFVAEGSGEPGQIIGVGGEIGIEGEDSAFSTYRLPEPAGSCSNDTFRDGAGKALPDCRAYELVSPLDKAGGDIQARLNLAPFEARMDQAALHGDSVTYSSYRAFQIPKSGSFSSQYLAERDAVEGWQTEAISPPQEGEGFVNPALAIDNLFRAFSADLGFAWLMTFTEPVLGEGGLSQHPNLYRRNNASGVYEGCTTLASQLSEDGTHGPQLQGFSADQNLGVFRLENKLTDNASEKLRVGGGGTPIYQAYACSYEGGVAKLSLVSVLPDGTASELENTVGGPANEQFQLDQGRAQSLENAVSADGSKVFWTASPGIDANSPGALYLRRNPMSEQTPSGACEESAPEKACTVLIDAGPARFWTAAEDGSVALYSNSAGSLREYDTAAGVSTPIAGELLGVLGASEDVTLVYYLSEDKIGGEGVDGEPNLYLHDAVAESETFIATLSERDAPPLGALSTSTLLTPGNPRPAFHTSRVTPDGQAVAFMSNSAALAKAVAGYDNTDQVGNLPAAEIYRYAVGGELACVSCNRTGQRPRGREVQDKTLFTLLPPLYAASLLPPWLNSLYAPKVLSADGNRIFFEAYEPLVLTDTNGKTDVYQWEAKGTGTCSEGQSAYDPQSEGCVSLITSGTATTDSQFVDASPEGDDVFVRTAASLVPWDPGQIDIYDARVGGGFAGPPAPEPPCEGETCQNPAPPPNDPTPGSANYTGPGNVKPQSNPPKKCPKGKHKVKKNGKTKCVKNKKKKNNKNKKQANKNKGASR